MTGFLGVTTDKKRFTARLRHGGKIIYLGTFDTAEEAALAVARRAVLAAQKGQSGHLTATEAWAAAHAEGLELLRSANGVTGFLGVTTDKKRFRARLKQGDKLIHLGSFDTAEEAALAVARDPIERQRRTAH